MSNKGKVHFLYLGPELKKNKEWPLHNVVMVNGYLRILTPLEASSILATTANN